MTNHTLITEAGSAWEQAAGRCVVGYCDDCHAPDDSGVGGTEFYGTFAEVVEQYEEHVRG